MSYPPHGTEFKGNHPPHSALLVKNIPPVSNEEGDSQSTHIKSQGQVYNALHYKYITWGETGVQRRMEKS